MRRTRFADRFPCEPLVPSGTEKGSEDEWRAPLKLKSRARPLIMRSRRIAAQAAGLGILAGLLASQAGCSSGPSTWSWSAPSFAHLFEVHEPLRNPLTVPSTDF